MHVGGLDCAYYWSCGCKCLSSAVSQNTILTFAGELILNGVFACIFAGLSRIKAAELQIVGGLGVVNGDWRCSNVRYGS